MTARLALALALAAWPGPTLADDAERGALAGRIKDPLGGIVAGAEVSATGPSGVKTTRSDSDGAYTLSGLIPGTYSVLVTMDRFAPHASEPIAVPAGQTTRLDVSLALGREEDVTVQSTQPALSLDPSNNAGAIVITGKDLEALPEDPDELADALQALAGPAAGPSGGQIFVDGFTGGRLPPLASIREIRINANPFSAEHDRLGFGRIEILTKPGSDRLRAQTSFRFGDESLNARNPFAPNKPSYQRRQWGGTLGGPLTRKLSFFLDFEQRDVDDNEIVNATVLTSELEPVPFNEAVLARQRRTTFSPRLDWQPSPAHTLTARYSYSSSERANAGVGGFSLPSRAYGTGQREHTLQLSETATFGKAVSETRLRFWSERQSRAGDDSEPGLQVLDAFSGGGSQVGSSLDEQRRWELHNVTSWTLGSHSLRAGFRLRTVRERDDARQGFGGNVTFASGTGPLLDELGQPVLGDDGLPTIVRLSSLERYRRTLMLQQLGMDPGAIRALGGGASQLQISGGNPETSVSQWDWAPFVQDDWRVSPDVLLSAGLRYELQNNIDSSLNLAPRVAFAWSPGADGPDTPARTVVRGGFGIFYDRFGQDLTLRARRYDGQHLTEYVVDDPAVLDQLRFDTDGVSGVPSVAELDRFALPQATWTVAPDLQTPHTAQSSLSLERLLPGNFTLIGSFVASQGRRLLRSRNVNAPLPDGSRPLGDAAGDVYQVESTGRLNQLQWILGVNNRLSPNLTLFFRYRLGRARSDTEGANSFPANSHDLAGEYGRSATDVRHRVILGGNVTVPGGIRVSPFLIASTGGAYNITTGTDLNGDGLFTDRPAFSGDAAAPDVVSTPYGLLDPTPDPGSPLVVRNLGEGPGFLVMNLRLSRTISLGGKTPAPDPQRDPGSAPGLPGGFRGGRGRFGDGETGRGLTISLSAQNLLNHVNPGAPVGNIGSPFFGQSLSSAGGFGRGGGASAGRRIELEVRFSF